LDDKLPIITQANYRLPLDITLSSVPRENLGIKNFSFNSTVIIITEANYNLPFNFTSSMCENKNLAVMIKFISLKESYDCNSFWSEIKFAFLSFFMYFALCLLIFDVVSDKNNQNKNEIYDFYDNASLLNFTLESDANMDSIRISSSVDCDTYSFLLSIDDGDDCLSSKFSDIGDDVPDDVSLLNYSLECDDIDDIFCISSKDAIVTYSFLFGIDIDDELTSIVSAATSTSSALPVVVSCSFFLLLMMIVI
jgi:hypothetical protein